MEVSNLELDKKWRRYSDVTLGIQSLTILKVYLLLLHGNVLGVRVSALGNMFPSLEWLGTNFLAKNLEKSI